MSCLNETDYVDMRCNRSSALRIKINAISLYKVDSVGDVLASLKFIEIFL